MRLFGRRGFVGLWGGRPRGLFVPSSFLPLFFLIICLPTTTNPAIVPFPLPTRLSLSLPPPSSQVLILGDLSFSQTGRRRRGRRSGGGGYRLERKEPAQDGEEGVPPPLIPILPPFLFLSLLFFFSLSFLSLRVKRKEGLCKVALGPGGRERERRD